MSELGNLFDLVLEERPFEAVAGQARSFRALVPRADGRRATLTTRHVVAEVDLERPELGWRLISDLPTLLADDEETVWSLAWGPCHLTVIRGSTALLLDGSGRVLQCFDVPDKGTAFDVSGRDLLTVAYLGDHVGLYRLEREPTRVEVVLPPSFRTRDLFPGEGRIEHGLLGRSGRVHLFRRPGGEVETFAWSRGKRRLLRPVGLPVRLSSSVDDGDRWVRVAGRLFAVGPWGTARLVDLARRLCAPHPALPALLNPPMVELLWRADPATARAVTGVLALASATWQPPSRFSDADEGLVAITPGSGGDLWVATTCRTLRVDLGRARRMVRRVPWRRLGDVFPPVKEASAERAAVQSLLPGRRGWLRRLLESTDGSVGSEGVVAEARLRGLDEEDVVAALGRCLRVTPQVASTAAELVAGLCRDPQAFALTALGSSDPVRVRLGLLATARRAVRVRDEEETSRRLSWSSVDGPGLRPAGLEPPPAERQRLARAVVCAEADRFPAETARCLSALGTTRGRVALRRIVARSKDPTARRYAALALLAQEPDDLDAAEALLRSVEEDRALSPDTVLDELAGIFPSGRGVVRAALAFVGGHSSAMALRVVGQAEPQLMFELLAYVGATLFLHRCSWRGEGDPLDGLDEVEGLMRSLDVDDGPYVTTDPCGHAALAAVLLALARWGAASSRLDTRGLALLPMALTGGWGPTTPVALDDDLAVRRLFLDLMSALWDRRPHLAAVLRLVWPLLPGSDTRLTAPSTRRRGSVVAMHPTGAPRAPVEVRPGQNEALAILQRQPSPAERVLLEVWRTCAVGAGKPGAVEALLAPGALGPYHDLRFLLVPCLEPERVRALAVDMDRRRTPLWLDAYLDGIGPETAPTPCLDKGIAQGRPW